MYKYCILQVFFDTFLESSDSNIANIGAIFLGKSAKENMGCVQCKMEAEVRLLVVPLLKVDETLCKNYQPYKRAPRP